MPHFAKAKWGIVPAGHPQQSPAGDGRKNKIATQQIGRDLERRHKGAEPSELCANAASDLIGTRGQQLAAQGLAAEREGVRV